MSKRVRYDNVHKRDVGDGVLGYCDYPGCGTTITRDMYHICGSAPFGGKRGCGLFFCDTHLSDDDDTETLRLCERCAFNAEHMPYEGRPPFTPTLDHPNWITFKLNHSSWRPWRIKHPADVRRLREDLRELQGK